MSVNFEKPNLLVQWLFMKEAASDPRLSRTAVACAFHLTDLHNKNRGYAWPSYETLAERTGSHRRTVIDAVKKLLDLEYFYVQTGNGRRSNHYFPNFALVEFGPGGTTSGDADATSPGTPTPPLQAVAVQPATPDTSYIPVASSGGDIEVSPRSAGSSARRAPSPSRGAPPGFEAFWQEYPKKEGLKGAIEAYEAALQAEGVTPDLLATKAAQYAAAKAQVPPRYIKRPQYWLNEECWLEDPQPPSDPKPKAPRKSLSRPRKKHEKTVGTVKASRKAAKKNKKKTTKSRQTSPAFKEIPRGDFAQFYRLFCEYLEITLDDLAAATGMSKVKLRDFCDGKTDLPIETKDTLRCILVKAVMFPPEDQPLSREILCWWHNRVKEAPDNDYVWREPKFFAGRNTLR